MINDQMLRNLIKAPPVAILSSAKTKKGVVWCTQRSVLICLQRLVIVRAIVALQTKNASLRLKWRNLFIWRRPPGSWFSESRRDTLTTWSSTSRDLHWKLKHNEFEKKRSFNCDQKFSCKMKDCPTFLGFGNMVSKRSTPGTWWVQGKSLSRMCFEYIQPQWCIDFALGPCARAPPPINNPTVLLRCWISADVTSMPITCSEMVWGNDHELQLQTARLVPGKTLPAL